LIVGGGSAGHPPAGLCCLAGQGADEGTSPMTSRHRLKNIINNWRRLWESTWSLLLKQKSRTVTGDQKHPSSKEGERIEQICGLCLADLDLRAAYLHSYAVIL
jgi:hypothetical protein